MTAQANGLTEAAQNRIIRTACVPIDHPQPARALVRELGSTPFDTVILFASPRADTARLLSEMSALLPATRIAGCTTAGEIGPEGYTEDTILALGLAPETFRSRVLLLEDLSIAPTESLVRDLLAARHELMREVPDWDHEFAFLMVDGMSLREDELAIRISSALGPVPLFGGSAGDMHRFNRTQILSGNSILQGAAVLLILRTRCPVRVFRTDHFHPTRRQMVVTRAAPEKRIVSEINGAPAGPEYARILGMDPHQLDTFTFASHPVVVRIGDQHHVRSIQRVAPNGDLHFFSAIGEGLVLTLADMEDMAGHLSRELTLLSSPTPPDLILGCDCLLRRIEAEEKQALPKLSRILSGHRVFGFSTYGEQYGAMHVNQTFTGVAIYPPTPERRP